ncbi:TPA: glucose-6-phosphate dehydrogenase [Streptococcus suis]
MTKLAKQSGLMVLFGASGDLARRELYPALYKLYDRGLLAQEFAVLGSSREEWSDQEFRDYIKDHMEKQDSQIKIDPDFLKHLYYQPADITEAESFKGLKDKAEEVINQHQTGDDIFYYLSIAPSFIEAAAENLKQADFFALANKQRLVVEKPFGSDQASAEALYKHLNEIFDAKDIYLTDHFAAMDFNQNILATRFTNPTIEAIWNKDYISNVQISLPESMSIGIRGEFYDSTGALLDMFQNHILQILVNVAMELPKELTEEAIHKAKIEALQNVSSMTKKQVGDRIVRGQYIGDEAGKNVAYVEEAGVELTSQTETFVAGDLRIQSDRWKGVPFYFYTGKSLDEHYFKVDLVFKSPHQQANHPTSRLTFYIEPAWGMQWVLEQKRNEQDYSTQATFLKRSPEAIERSYVPNPYENVLYDAFAQDKTTFVTIEEILEQWRITDAIIKHWETETSLEAYPYKSSGPQAMHRLTEANGHHWIIES